MSAYSPDLRERVIAAACETDLTQPEIAATFSISLSCVEEWWRIFRTTARTAPLPFAGGAKRVLQPYAEVIRTAVALQPDATLAELCAAVTTQTGVGANSSMMCRELQRLNLPRKKVAARQPTRNRTRPSAAPSASRPDRGDAAVYRGTPEIHR